MSVTATNLPAFLTTAANFWQVRRPVGPNGLLVAPQYYPASYCKQVQQQHDPATTCAGPGFFPSFNASLPQVGFGVRGRPKRSSREGWTGILGVGGATPPIGEEGISCNSRS